MTLEKDRDQLEGEIVALDEELEMVRSTEESQVLQLHKAIQSTRELISEEELEMQRIEAEREKTEKEYNIRYEEITGNIEKEKALIQKLGEEIAATEQELASQNEQFVTERDDFAQKIGELKTLISSMKEVMEDNEKLREFVRPELAEYMKQKETFFLNEEVLEMKEQEEKGKKKRKGKPRPKTVKRKVKKVPKVVDSVAVNDGGEEGKAAPAPAATKQRSARIRPSTSLTPRRKISPAKTRR
jgi:chromosome segregation ATPase